MDTLLDLLWLRIPSINYVCPPICDFFLSGSGSETIVLEQHPTLTKVTGLSIDGLTLSWSAYPKAICYTVYRADVGSENFEIVSECAAGTTYEFTGTGCFRVSAITTEGETPLSDAVCS